MSQAIPCADCDRGANAFDVGGGIFSHGARDGMPVFCPRLLPARLIRAVQEPLRKEMEYVDFIEECIEDGSFNAMCRPTGVHVVIRNLRESVPAAYRGEDLRCALNLAIEAGR